MPASKAFVFHATNPKIRLLALWVPEQYGEQLTKHRIRSSHQAPLDVAHFLPPRKNSIRKINEGFTVTFCVHTVQEQNILIGGNRE